MSESKAGSHGNLTLYIIIAIVAAVVLSLMLPALSEPDWITDAALAAAVDDGGELSRPWTQVLVEDVLQLGGEIFLNLLFMLVVPLVVLSVMAGILSLGDVRKLGRPGLYAILYYLVTTLLAVTVGLLLANALKPGLKYAAAPTTAEQVAEATDDDAIADGSMAAEAAAEAESKIAAASGEGAPDSVGDAIRRIIEKTFTSNLIDSAANQDLLPLILFSIVFAAILTTRMTQYETLHHAIVQASDVLMLFVMLVMRIAPLGIFCLVAGRFGAASLQGQFFTQLGQLGWYAATVTLGLAVHALMTLPLIYWVIRGENPYRFLARMSEALLTAFGTSSSSATLPVTIETATDNAGVSKKAAGFVLPLGATINMDGTALYEATAALFIAQMAGGDIGLLTQILIAITATLAAIGAAGVPEAGLVTMLIVLKAIGFSQEEAQKYVATIIPIDWLLDRIRTTVNVFGDATGAAVLTPQLPDRPGDSNVSDAPTDDPTAAAVAFANGPAGAAFRDETTQVGTLGDGRIEGVEIADVALDEESNLHAADEPSLTDPSDTIVLDRDRSPQQTPPGEPDITKELPRE